MVCKPTQFICKLNINSFLYIGSTLRLRLDLSCKLLAICFQILHIFSISSSEFKKPISDLAGKACKNKTELTVKNYKSYKFTA